MLEHNGAQGEKVSRMTRTRAKIKMENRTKQGERREVKASETQGS